jgi:hypothetical protein
MRIRYWLYLGIICMVITSCEPNNYSADQLEQTQKDSLLYSMVRHFGKLPKRHASHKNKFEERFDDHYRNHAGEHKVLAYYSTSDGKEYLLVQREAPSLHKKFVATGIVFEREGDSLLYYEEVFRSWKMPEAELKEKGLMLFDMMVKGEDLSPFYPQHSGEEEYIEFPDARNAFDSKSRRWLHPSLVSP